MFGKKSDKQQLSPLGLALIEAMSFREQSQEISKKLRENRPYCSLVAVYEDSIVYEDYSGSRNDHYQAPYTIDEAGSVAIGDAVRVRHESNWIPYPEQVVESVSIDALTESVDVHLTEAKTGKNVVGFMKIIEPGWGSSGYYPESVLERDGSKAFPAGTKMYWNHPTMSESVERPERSLSDLAAILIEDATYMKDGEDGPGLYARSVLMSDYSSKIKEIHEADKVNVSIRTSGTAHIGIVEGQEGRIVDSLLHTPHTSVDFVTEAGAGGRVVGLEESRRIESKEEVVKDQDKATAEPVDNSPMIKSLAKRTVLAEAKSHVLSIMPSQLPQATKDRIVTLVNENLPLIEKDGLPELDMSESTGIDAVFKKFLDAEVAYLKESAGINLIKDNNGPSAEAITERAKNVNLTESFGRLGLSESGAKLAASRGN